jgi:DNA-binding IclR family transcriptional regulator
MAPPSRRSVGSSGVAAVPLSEGSRRGATGTKPTDTVKKRGQYSTPAVEKAFAVLEFLSRREAGARMVDVVDELGLPKSSAFVLLNCLHELGYLSRDHEGRYRLTSRMFELGMRAVQNMDLTEIALPHLENLRDLTGMTVHLAGRDGSSVVYQGKIDGPGFVRFNTYVGKRTPVHLTAVGKALAAYVPEDELERIANTLDFSPRTDRSITSKTALKVALKKVRERGYALDDEEEEPGVRCVAAPIRNHQGTVVASAGVVSLAQDLRGDALKRVTAAVIATTRAISAELGTPLAE